MMTGGDDDHARIRHAQGGQGSARRGLRRRAAVAVTEQISVAVGENVATKNDVALVRSDLEKLELRMTIKMYAAVAGGVGLFKALDFLIG